MPVGSSDQGVGLGAGDIMLGGTFNYQFIDWRHDPTPDENFEHLGTLSAMVISPNITIGLSDWWNITFTQALGKRYMTWGREEESDHHRDEGSESNFINSIGGYLGDSRIMVRYLFLNAGKGIGSRLFFGGGIVIPSKNTLTSDPFFLETGNVEEHRHFSMSEGVYKAVFETQFYIKRVKNPVFVGGTLLVEQPLRENDYGFKASRLIDLSFMAYTKNIKSLKGSLGASFMVRHTNKAYWNGIAAPNSESVLLIPGVGILWNFKFATVMLNLQKPTFMKGSAAGTTAYLNENTEVWQLSLSMRKILDYTIPWLYW